MYPIESLYRYPVKGLSAETLQAVTLQAGQAFPLDRHFAITNGAWEFQAEGYSPRPKTDFLVLVNLEQLAEYQSDYDAARNVLTLRSPDGIEHPFNLGLDEDRRALSGLFQRRFGDRLKGAPQVVEAEGIRFTDVSVISEPMMNAISLINLASVEAFAADIGAEVDPMRFRANVYFRTQTPWEELDWVGREVRIGDAVGKVVLRTRRCVATNVNPSTAERDLSIPKSLMQLYGHPDMGVYIELQSGGQVRVGDPLELL